MRFFNQISKILVLFLTLNFFCFTLNAQNKDSTNIVKKQFWGLTPVNKNRFISGLALGFTAKPWSDSFHLKINGLNIEINPLGIVGGIWGSLHAVFGNTGSESKPERFMSKNGYPDDLKYLNVEKVTKINGVSISFGGLSETINNGLIINGMSGMSYKTNGIQLSGLINFQDEFNGIMIAGLFNKTRKGNGIQIGLFNNCESGKILQIGLINRIGKRVLPFININL